MQTYQQNIAELKHSPQLPKAIEELNAYWQDEQTRRRKFLEEMDEESKAEFIEGEILLHSPAKDKHNAVVSALNSLIDVFLAIHGLGIVRVEKAMLHLMRNNFEPDLAFWSVDKSVAVETNTMLYPVPDLVCEVLSSSTSKRDRGIKFTDYAANGIIEYWIIDPDRKTLEQYILENGEYGLTFKSKSEAVESKAIKGLSFNVEAIFDKKQRIHAIQEFLRKN